VASDKALNSVNLYIPP